MCICERASVQGREPCRSYVCSFSQLVFNGIYRASGTLLCGQDMMLNRIGINDFMWWLRRRGKSSPSQGTHDTGDPKARLWGPSGRPDCMVQSFVPGEAQGNWKLGLTSAWELSV